MMAAFSLLVAWLGCVAHGSIKCACHNTRTHSKSHFSFTFRLLFIRFLRHCLSTFLCPVTKDNGNKSETVFSKKTSMCIEQIITANLKVGELLNASDAGEKKSDAVVRTFESRP